MIYFTHYHVTCQAPFSADFTSMTGAADYSNQTVLNAYLLPLNGERDRHSSPALHSCMRHQGSSSDHEIGAHFFQPGLTAPRLLDLSGLAFEGGDFNQHELGTDEGACPSLLDLVTEPAESLPGRRSSASPASRPARRLAISRAIPRLTG